MNNSCVQSMSNIVDYNHKFSFSYQSDLVLCDDNATYHFKYTIPTQIEEEINVLFRKRLGNMTEAE